MRRTAEVAIIGGGIVGCAIAYSLTRRGVRCVLLERNLDVGEGTSKANSGIVHTGFDAKPETLEARLLADARSLWQVVAEELRVPLIPSGAVMVARDEAEFERIRGPITATAAANEVAVEVVDRATLLESWPFVTPHAAGGLVVPGESLVDPFWATRAYAEAAVLGGAELILGATVVGIEIRPHDVRLALCQGDIVSADIVINAAGLWADEVARLAGDDSLSLTPRKGQFILAEDDLGIGSIMLPVPTPTSKGILVSPLAIGGLLMGPTAEDVSRKDDLATTADGLAAVRRGAASLVPAVATVASVRQFAGLRAVNPAGDYIIRRSTVSDRLIHVAGIRSTGVSASPAIGEYVADLVTAHGDQTVREPEPDAAPEFEVTGSAEVVCLCRGVTVAEVERALRGPIPARTLDAVKRRTGAMLGECQGNECAVAIARLIAESQSVPLKAVERGPIGSSLGVPREVR